MIICGKQTSVYQLITFLYSVFILHFCFDRYRIIKKRIFAMHVAVMRDGARLVLDDHLRGRPFLAGLHVSTVIVVLKS